MPSILNIRCLLLVALGICTGTTVYAQSASRLIKEGDKYFEHDKFRAALQYYKQGGNVATWDKDVKLRVAMCQYEVNEIDGAIPLLAELVREGKTKAEVYLYLARCYHQKNQFLQAVSFYKQFLRKYHDDDALRLMIKDELIRCSNGISMRYATERAYVENMGASINSFGDEYAPVPSPNYDERLYFSSAREDSEGGMLTDDGVADPKYGKYRSDIYYSEYENGVWRSAVPMDHVLNTRYDEEIFGFSADGQKMYYLRSHTANSGDLMIDTFSVASRSDTRGVQLGSFDPRNGDRDLFMYNDSIMLFASERAGGYGGYDLYYSVKQKGRWGSASNLGGIVNSFYDDVSPFLARNGRILYFSSNRLESLGGLDIFTATFEDSTRQWSPVVNMGIPINSAGDETDFFLAADGLKAFLVSDHKTGFGQRDLYSAYFKDQVREHLTLSVPVTFAQLSPVQQGQAAPATPTTPTNVREYVISDLWFDPNDVVITPQNIKKLEVLANLLLIYPTLTLDLICHDVPSGPRSYTLFFSVKKAEQVAEFLEKKGVSANRLHAKGCGAYYPIAGGNGDVINNPAVERLNRRIEVHVYHAEGQPVSLTMEKPNIPDELRDPRGAKFYSLQNQLLYRVQIANVPNLFEHAVFDEYSDAMVDYDPMTRKYRYLIGMETKFQNALVLRDALSKEGFTDALVVPYINGEQVAPGDISKYLEQYPDLLNFTQ